MTRDHETFAAVLEALFGPNNVEPAAAAFKTRGDTVRKWKTGRSEIPAGIWDEAAALCAARGAALVDWARRLGSKPSDGAPGRKA